MLTALNLMIIHPLNASSMTEDEDIRICHACIDIALKAVGRDQCRGPAQRRDSGGVDFYERRSACQVPEHSPPVQDPVPKSPESLPDRLATFWHRFNNAKETRGVSMFDKEPKPLTREQVVTLLGKHAKELATLARENGCETLYFLFQTAAEQAEKELGRSPSDGESSVS